jgi:hypothetical protein
MKKFYYHLKGILYGYPKRSTLLDGLTISPITVVYPKCLVMGILREECVKVWHVAVKTVQPDKACATHADWMITMMCEKANCVADIATLEYKEIAKDMLVYKNGAKPLKFIDYEKVNH